MSDSETHRRPLSLFPKHPAPLWKSLVPGTSFAQETRLPGLFLPPAYANKSSKQSHSETFAAPEVIALRVSPLA